MRLSLKHTLVSFGLLVGLVISSKTQAAVLFEGWSKVLISGQHIGYMVQRYEYDEKKKEFKEIHFLKTSAESGGLQESLVARANSSFKPLSYQYTGLVNGAPLTIDATFKNDVMTALVTEGKTKKTVTNKMPKDIFLSGFLGYVMLQGKEGLKKGVKYTYKAAVLEESATIVGGEAYVAAEETVSGIPVFRVLNTVNGAKYVALVTHKSEVLGTVSPTLGTQTVLVPTMDEAVAGFGVNTSNLVALFGSLPRGAENEIVRHGLKAAPKPAASPGLPKIPAPTVSAPTVTAPTAPTAPTTAPPETPKVEKPTVAPVQAPVPAPAAPSKGP